MHLKIFTYMLVLCSFANNLYGNFEYWKVLKNGPINIHILGYSNEEYAEKVDQDYLHLCIEKIKTILEQQKPVICFYEGAFPRFGSKGIFELSSDVKKIFTQEINALTTYKHFTAKNIENRHAILCDPVDYEVMYNYLITHQFSEVYKNFFDEKIMFHAVAAPLLEEAYKACLTMLQKCRDQERSSYFEYLTKHCCMTRNGLKKYKKFIASKNYTLRDLATQEEMQNEIFNNTLHDFYVIDYFCISLLVDLFSSATNVHDIFVICHIKNAGFIGNILREKFKFKEIESRLNALVKDELDAIIAEYSQNRKKLSKKGFCKIG